MFATHKLILLYNFTIKISSCLCLLLCVLPSYAQSPCGTCTCIVEKAEAFLNQPIPQYEEAIKKYQAAKLCDVENAALYDKKILTIFQEINRLYQQSERNRKVAIAAKLKAIKAEEDLKIALEEAIKANEEADANLNLAKQSDSLRLIELEKTQEAYEALAETLDQKEVETRKKERLKHLSFSKNLAIKSIAIPPQDKDVKLTLAKVAYDMYSNANPDYFDSDIYNSLYYANKSIWGEDFNVIRKAYVSINDLEYDHIAHHLYIADTGGFISLEPKIRYDTLLMYVPPFKHQDDSYNVVKKFPGKNLVIYGGKRDNIPDVYQIDSQEKLSIDERSFITPNNQLEITDILFLTEHEFISLATNGTTSTLTSFLLDETTFSVKQHKEFSISIQKINPHPSNSSMIILMVDGKIQLYNLTTQTLSPLFTINNFLKATPTCFTSDIVENMLFIGDNDGNVYRYEIDSDDIQLISPNVHKAMISDITIKNGALAVSSYDTSFSVWDVKEMDSPKYFPVIIKDHETWVTNISFLDTEERLVTSSRDGVIKYWLLNKTYLSQEICSEIEYQLNDSEWNQLIGNEFKKYNLCE